MGIDAVYIGCDGKDELLNIYLLTLTDDNKQHYEEYSGDEYIC